MRMGFAVHNIFKTSFVQMFRKTKTCGARPSGNDNGALMNLLTTIMCDSAGCDQETLMEKPEEVAAASFTTSDVPIGKVQGVRATKSCSWIERPSTAVELLVAILSTEPVGHLSAWLLKAQKLKSWLSKDPTERPLVNLVTYRFSPASRCVHELADMLLSGTTGRLDILDGSLVCD